MTGVQTCALPICFAVTVSYIRDTRDGVFGIDRTASALGVDYVEARETHSFDPGLWGQLRRLVRERQIDIVHAHDYKTDLLAWLLARVEPVTPLSTVHGWTGNTPRERWLYYPADKRLLAWFPALVAVSFEIRDELVRHGADPDRVVTILNGIDHRAFRRLPGTGTDVRASLGFSGSDVVLGTVGRLEQQKRFDLLIDAFAALHAGRPDLRLLIAGDGSLRARLQAQVARLGLGDVVCLAGHRSDIADLHSAMDVFVQSSDYEGTPNAVLEAMALETPIIATAAGGTADIARPSLDAIVVPPGNARALAQAIGEALGNPDAASARVASARHRVETILSFDARMDALESLYVRLQEGRQRARPAPMVART